MGQDILYLNENKKGSDSVIGDVHGNRGCLEHVMKQLQKGDRLFIVGDLTDRGHDSLGVIKLILKNGDRVFSIRGNHEDQCLDTINCLEALALRKSHLFKSSRFKNFLKGENYSLKSLFADFNAYENNEHEEDYEEIKFHLENHRLWLVDLFCYELRHNRITVHKDYIEYGEQSNIKRIEEYMSNLPYIIHVAGIDPFNVVHADMPFDNFVLIERIEQGNLQLTKEEKKYATWARGGKKEPFLAKTNSDGVITYVGHNIIEGKGNNLPIVRFESSTVNIDVATYKINSSLMVNHTKKSSSFTGLEAPPKNLLVKKNILDNYLASRHQPEQLISTAKTFDEHVEENVIPVLDSLCIDMAETTATSNTANQTSFIESEITAGGLLTRNNLFSENKMTRKHSAPTKFFDEQQVKRRKTDKQPTISSVIDSSADMDIVNTKQSTTLINLEQESESNESRWTW
ncbi:Serine/threonine-protein phosphatase 1 [Legionella beliardensis]|uniref:Serine/threonine-protein phosphatase 1 n=1 Tax=Legionella beliardensis TaxID=91822 RepID=A0A378JTF5_9GAMM|nr:metallophosphoesterase [Legionella beliardensis]STX55559.1 Serine/threonine-protein phosphatase 1 [Legionella beliardensis]